MKCATTLPPPPTIAKLYEIYTDMIINVQNGPFNTVVRQVFDVCSIVQVHPATSSSFSASLCRPSPPLRLVAQQAPSTDRIRYGIEAERGRRRQTESHTCCSSRSTAAVCLSRRCSATTPDASRLSAPLGQVTCRHG